MTERSDMTQVTASGRNSVFLGGKSCVFFVLIKINSVGWPHIARRNPQSNPSFGCELVL